jgi:CDGSH-type Zn-finger protein
VDVVVTPYRDGPLLVRGPVRIQDQDGEEIVVEREVVALCRCGKSRTRPLCDGTHKLVHFRAPSGMEEGPRAPIDANGNGASNGRRDVERGGRLA